MSSESREFVWVVALEHYDFKYSRAERQKVPVPQPDPGLRHALRVQAFDPREDRPTLWDPAPD